MGCGSSPEIHWNHRKSLEDRTSDDPTHRSGSTGLTGSRVCYGSLGFSSSPSLSLSVLCLSLPVSLSLSISLCLCSGKRKNEERRRKEKKEGKEKEEGEGDPVMQGIREKMREKLLKCPSH
jgi:hypothetical protein